MGEFFVGADGGGTKTRIVALDGAGREIAAAQGGSINYNFIGMDEAVAHFAQGFKKLCLPAERIAAVSVGNPAMDDEGEDPQAGLFARELVRAAGIMAPTGVYMKSDVFMALYGLTRGEEGVLLVGGTGSMGLARDASGRLFTVGGWGRPTADGGSALYIAVEGLSAVFRARDGVGPDTLLTRSALRFYGAKSPRGLIGIFNDPRMKNAAIAAFAPEVAACADRGDGEALRVLAASGKMLAGYAISLLKKIGSQDCPVGMYGGVLINCARVRDAFIGAVAQTFPRVVPRVPDIPPERAAALYAMDEEIREKRR